MTPRAITGLGIASALGTGTAAEHAELLARLAGLAGGPRSVPLAAPKSFDGHGRTDLPIVEVPDFDPSKYLGDKGLRTLDRLTKLLVVAARLALSDGGLKKPGGEWTALDPNKVGVCCSNAYGSLEAITELDRVAVLEDARYINPAKFPNTVSNSASGYVSIWEDLRALNVSVSDGNCGALDAMSCADIFLATGRAEAILTGGGEAMSEALWLAFDKLGVLGTDASDPGQARLGEGAAFFVIEPEAGAAARGANVLATVTGYGTAFISPEDDVTLLWASRVALERAIAFALADAKITAADVDLVVSGVSGIALFDDEERAAIDAVVGASTPVAAPKLAFGETLGSGGALGMAAALAWLGGTPPSCLVRGEAGEVGVGGKKLEHVLVTSVGYYGNASALVMRRSAVARRGSQS